MDSRFSPTTFFLQIFFICSVLSCSPRNTNERTSVQPIVESIASRNLKGFQQAADPQSAEPKPPANDTDPLFPVVEHKKWGYMDKNGKIVILPKYYNAYRFTEGIARTNCPKVQRNIYLQFRLAGLDLRHQRLHLVCLW
jgi:hypothetical protein